MFIDLEYSFEKRIHLSTTNNEEINVIFNLIKYLVKVGRRGGLNFSLKIISVITPYRG